MGKYDKLLSPIQITPTVTFKNRMIKSAQSSWLWNEDGTAEGSRAIDMYENMARGGAAAIDVAAILWEDAGTGIYLRSDDDKYIPGYKELTSRLHAYGCKAIGQLHHMGPSAWRAPDDTRLPIGASSLEEDEIPTPPPFGSKTRGLSVEEIHEKVVHISDAAYRLYQGGFDCVEIHAANGYLLNSWLSPIWNKRTDEYSWEKVENRTRMMREIYEAVRRKCGPDFCIGTRINGQEWSPQYSGITPEIAAETARELVKIGYQYINVSGYGYGPLSFRYCPDYFPYPDPEPHMQKYMQAYRTEGILRAGARAVKAAVGKDIPVFTAGRMDENLAEEAIENGDADVICLGRTLWADPEFPNKVAEGRIDEIRRCTRCASCEDPVTQPRYCRVNPGLGHEKEFALTPAKKVKKVMVIGGGPAGMEAAIDAAMRGHNVTLYEKSPELGGRIKLASMIKGASIEDIMPLYNYLTTMIRKTNVRVVLKTEVTPKLIADTKPDVVISAISSPYYVPTEAEVPGIKRKNVFNIPQMTKLSGVPMRMFGPRKLEEMSEKIFPIGKKVAVIGAGIEGTQCAEFLLKRNKQLVMLAETDDIGGQIPLKYKERIEPWFADQPIEIVKNAKLVEVDRKGIWAEVNGERKHYDVDSVMIMYGERYDSTFYDSIKDLAPEVYEIGSEKGGENVLLKHALHDGREVACRI